MTSLNELTAPEFTEKIGWVFEHSPWVAERVFAARPFTSLDDLHTKMTEVVAGASREEQLALLRAHPDLGTRARMSVSSRVEQSGAGLDQLTAEEFGRLQRLNDAYQAKFGFPFLFAVKGSGKTQILEALERRYQAGIDEEFQEALRQVYRIARFRLQDTIGTS